MTPTSAVKQRAKLRSLIERDAGERGHGAVGVRVLGDVVLGGADAVVLGDLRLERSAELALVGRPAEEQHEAPGDGERDVAAVVVLDQRQRQVHAGGDAGGRPHVAVAHVDRLGLDLHAREAAGEEVAHPPVRRGALARRGARLGEDERTGAHAGDRGARRRPAVPRG